MGDDTLSTTDLLNFNNSIVRSNPYGIAGAGLGAWQPNMQTWSGAESGLVSFGKSFLAGLLGNYAREDAAKQLQQVVSVMPQLTQNPGAVALPQGVDSDAFNVLKGTAMMKSAMREANTISALQQRGIDITDPSLQHLSISDRVAKILGKQKAEEAKGAITGQLEAYGLTPGATPTPGAEKIPGSPLYESNKDAREALISLRKEFNALDPVKNFAKASQSASALSAALKDTGKVSDQELVRYAIQMIEPGLSVREGEQAAIAGSQSITESWKNQLTSALKGGTALGDDVREGIRRLAVRAYSSHKGLYDQAFELYGKEAKMQGFEPSRLSYIGEAPAADAIFGGPIGGSSQVDSTGSLQELEAIRDKLKAGATAEEKRALMDRVRQLTTVPTVSPGVPLG